MMHAMRRMKPIVSNNELFYIKPIYVNMCSAELCLGLFLSMTLCLLLYRRMNSHMFIPSQAGRGQQAALIECEE
jgi:hypothetical protein